MEKLEHGIIETEIRVAAKTGVIKEFHVEQDKDGFTAWLRIAGRVDTDLRWVRRDRTQPRRFMNLHRLHKLIALKFPQITTIIVHLLPPSSS